MYASYAPYEPARRYGRGDDAEAGRDLVLLIYVLYIAGFFTGVTALIGVIIAHRSRRFATGLKRAQLDWQVRMFWYGLFALIVIGMIHLMVTGLGAITGGLGLVFMVVPWGLTLTWGILTAWAIARGVHAALLNRPVVSAQF
ncbi:hypothetical protein [Gluconobacter roseus]|uniref:Transmembrane protein n=1 Tax=Gluconobacter roseus NBRC 3990 TaxID=1307950 RepID=A0A4Y3M6K1_9PROT|nr:hypothetical protein [Gluconobacter roseus]KXV42825.1 hypothetical protein AD943_12260 [Gluconobacter roseus]GBR48972.1 hypothetical protein AA3990_2337 [Gluconobacter roseus NBRC 3990]GEB04294.1 hypothetical protein GRO01_18700 [Gluconobacter roseus NBRC 3990]GLP92737.1 hypothetical protein GCM10007871_07150 [Gluconobacter roseus NBRC 3990]